MSRILNPSFKYTSAASTDIRKTFARIRKEQQRVKEEAARVVKPLIRNKVA